MSLDVFPRTLTTGSKPYDKSKSLNQLLITTIRDMKCKKEFLLGIQAVHDSQTGQ